MKNQLQFDTLEARILLANTPASVLTKAMRQTLVSNLDISINASLQYKLNTNNLAGFDQQLLDYFKQRSSSHFFFDPGQVSSIVSYHNANLNTSDVYGRADDALAGSDTDSSDPDASSSRFDEWVDLGMAYRLGGDGKYADKLITELADFGKNNTPLSDPESQWRDAAPHWQRLDTSIQGENWSWGFSLMIGTSKWTKEANTLFLDQMYEHGRYLNAVSPMELISNQSLIQGQGLLYIGEVFPEFKSAATWETNGRKLLFKAMDAQIYPDGSDYEQSPTYAVAVTQRLLETAKLDARNGNTWTSTRRSLLKKAVDAVYQVLSPNGKTPAISDSFRSSLSYYFLKADIVLGSTGWSPGKPRARDLWLLGSAAVDPYKNFPAEPTLGTRPKAVPYVDSGNYIFRSGSDVNAQQINFDAGPRGGGHGHFDTFSFELSGFGKVLISDPGLYKYGNSTQRNWAISTPAHNTVSLDGKNVAALEGADNPGLVIDSYVVASDHVQITAHHFAYAGLAGGPVVTRSIWYNFNGTMLIVDWVEATESHKAQTSFLLPGTSTAASLSSGAIRTTHSSGNVRVQSILRSGQTSATKTTGIFTSDTSGQSSAATDFYTSATGSFVAFATLITAYNGASPPSISATWQTTPSRGQPVTLRLNTSGALQDIVFTPPHLNYPNSAGANNGSTADIAYGTDGVLHMAYYDRSTLQLKYTERNTSGDWSAVQIVDGVRQHGQNPSVAVNSDGVVGIAYYNAADGDLMYATNSGGSWAISTADATGTTGQMPSLAFARFDLPFVSYYDKTRGDLRLATIKDGSWTSSVIDDGDIGSKDVGKYSQLSLDPARDTVTKWGIAYEDTSGGRYLYAIQGTFKNGEHKNAYSIFEAAKAPSLGGYTSLAYDSDGKPAISFYDASISGLRIAQSSGTSRGGTKFSVSTVTQSGSVGYFSSLYYDSSSRATILFYNKDNDKGYKAVFSSGKWSVSALVDGGRELHVAVHNGTVAYTTLKDSAARLEVKFI